MNKPSKPKTAKKGTQVYKVLKAILNKDLGSDEKFISTKAAWTYFSLNKQIKISSSEFTKILRYYRDGLYSFKGKFVDEQPVTIFYSNPEDTSDEIQLEFEGELAASDGLIGLAEQCRLAGIDPSEVNSGWIKTKGLSVNVKKTVDEVEELNKLIDVAKIKIKEDLKKLDFRFKNTGGCLSPKSTVGVLNLADLHLGAFVQGLTKTPDYSSTILIERLKEAAEQVNFFEYGTVHVNILGDFIESLGMELGHANMWKEMENGIYGHKAISLCVEIIHEHLLQNINNLGEVNLIAGNHDRGSKDNKNDVEGLAAQTIAWGLGLLGYDVNFDSLILSQEYDGINYILLHGDKLLSKRKGKEIAWDYGKQGMFNFILEGHLHSRIQKAQATANVETTSIVFEDAGLTRRQHCPSVFTGNRYSEHGGWDALGGYLIIKNKRKGKMRKVRKKK